MNKKLMFGFFSFILLAVPSVSSAATCPSLSTNLWRGMHDASANGQVRELQTFLSNYYGVSASVIVTGYFGPITESYVFRFQREQGIQQVGRVGPITRAGIARVCATGATAPAAGTLGTYGAPAQTSTQSGTTVLNTGNQTSRPNIVVIMTDDQDDTGSMATLPKVKRLLADQGVTFKNSFVSFSLCCTSRASFLTGQYAHNHGVLGNDPSEDGGYIKLLPTESNTLPVWLQNVGYSTALFGKYLNGYGDGVTVPTTHVPAGWTEWQGMPDALGTYNYFGFSINHNGIIETLSPTEYQTDVLAARAADYIASVPADKPLFLWLTPIAPHFGGGSDDGTQGPTPAARHKGIFASLSLPQPPNFNETDMSDKPAFMQALPLITTSGLDDLTRVFHNRRETLLAVDDMVETILNALQRSGRLDNTNIIFTSDNGFSQGEHRRPEGKRVVYEESIRVPLIIRGPGIPKGEARAGLVNNLDVVATIVEATGATAGRALDGKSLSTTMQNANAPWRTALLVEGTDTAKSAWGWRSRFYAVRSDAFVYAHHIVPNEGELYDLTRDPYELQDKHSDTAYTNTANSLKTVLNALKSCIGSSCWFAGSIAPPSIADTRSATVGSVACSMTTNANVTTAGTPVTISWSSTNATSASDSSGRSIALSGSATVAPLQTTTYEYTFKGESEQVRCRQTITVNTSGLTISGLTAEERNVLARALGYYGEFGDGGIYAWLTFGSRKPLWDTITASLLAHSGDSASEIYELFPSLDPNYVTNCNVTKVVRDQMARQLGFDGMFNVTNVSGVTLGGELGAWINADAVRKSTWDSFCSP